MKRKRGIFIIIVLGVVFSLVFFIVFSKNEDIAHIGSLLIIALTICSTILEIIGFKLKDIVLEKRDALNFCKKRYKLKADSSEWVNSLNDLIKEYDERLALSERWYISSNDKYFTSSKIINLREFPPEGIVNYLIKKYMSKDVNYPKRSPILIILLGILINKLPYSPKDYQIHNEYIKANEKYLREIVVLEKAPLYEIADSLFKIYDDCFS